MQVSYLLPNMVAKADNSQLMYETLGYCLRGSHRQLKCHADAGKEANFINVNIYKILVKLDEAVPVDMIEVKDQIILLSNTRGRH